MSVFAIVPAKRRSTGIPGKNWKALAGGPSPAVRAQVCALAAGVDRVIVSVDGEYADSDDDRVFWLARPAALAEDTTPMLDVVTHAMEFTRLLIARNPVWTGRENPENQDIFLLLQPTQPLRTPEHIQQAIALLQQSQADSVVSVVSVPQAQSPELMCWIGGLSGYLCPFDVKRGLYGGEPRDWSQAPIRRQDVKGDAFYRRDGTVYAFRRSTVSTYGTIYGSVVRPLIISPEETCPLDTEADWQEAERRLRARAQP